MDHVILMNLLFHENIFRRKKDEIAAREASHERKADSLGQELLLHLAGL